MAHDSEQELAHGDIADGTPVDDDKSLLNRRSYMKLSAAAAAAVGTAAATGTATAATTRHGISFDRVVNAVDDLGWDPDGNREIDVPTQDGLLIEVPPGEYVFPARGESGIVEGTVEQWGIRGLGDEPQDVQFRTSGGKSYFMNTGPSSRDVLLENVAFDNTDARRAGDIGNAIRARDGIEVWDVDHIGFSGKQPYCEWSLLPTIKSSGGRGRIVRYRKTGPSLFAGHGASNGAGGVFNHEGHLTFRDCEIHNQGGDGGLYTGKHPGKIVFDNCSFVNNDMGAIRTGAGSELRNCEVVVDWDNAHPDNVIDDEEPPTGAAGIYYSSAQHGKSGGGIYDTDVRILSTYKNGMAAIVINASDGNLDIHDTSVHVDVDGIPPVWFMDPRDQRFSSHTQPDRPWDADIRNLTVTGSGDCRGRAAVVLEGRHGSTIADSCIQMPNADGVLIDGSRDCSIENTNINVGGRATVFRDSNVATSDVARSNSCPLPDDSAGGRTGGSDDGSDDSTNTATGERVLDVEGDGEFCRYEFSVSESVDFNETPEDSIDGTNVSGAVAGTGADSFRFEGVVTDFTFTRNSARLVLDGEELSRSELVGKEAPVPDGSTDDSTDDAPTGGSDEGSNGPYRLTVKGSGEYARYAVAVTGGLVSLESGEESPDGATSQVGHIAGTGEDPYEVTGSVTEFEFETGEADLFLDGEPVTPSGLVERTSEDGSTGDGSDDGSADDSGGPDGGSDGSTDDGSDDETHRLTLRGSGEYARYAVEVSGELYSLESGEETPDGASSQVGHIAGTGEDPYEFTGEVTAFEFETGEADVFLDGDRVDPQSLVDADGLPSNTVSIVSASDRAASYRFTADGSVVANPDKGSPEDADNVSEKSAEGAVAGDTDSYRFAGSITNFDLDGEAAVYVNGTQVAPDLLGTDEDARLRNLIVVDGTGADGRCSYEFSVDGAVEKSLEFGTVEAEDVVDDGTVTGTVAGERDAYRFAGVLTGFDMDGSATLRFRTA